MTTLPFRLRAILPYSCGLTKRTERALGSARQRILIVDDNDDIRNLIVLTLKSAEYEVFSAPNGDDALSLIKEEEPDLVLLDVMMPNMSGIEVLAQIRSSKQKKINGALVMMISAKSQVADIDVALEAGADDYIVKPFRPQHLLEKVSNILSLEQ